MAEAEDTQTLWRQYRSKPGDKALMVVVGGALWFGTGSALAYNPDTLVTVGSPTTPFSQNKQNEPTITTDANNRDILVAGSNDEVDM